jgi:hypothetical protein
LHRATVEILVLFSGLAAMLLLAGCSSGSPSIQPPVPSYPTTAAVYTKGTAIAPDTPTNTGGSATSYAVAPPLPAGLTLSTTTGVISGTPTAVTARPLTLLPRAMLAAAASSVFLMALKVSARNRQLEGSAF